MTRLVTVAPFSIRRFVDNHKSEMFVCIQFPAGLFLLFYGIVYLLPLAFSGLLFGTPVAIIWAIFFLLLTGLCAALGVKLIIIASLQLMILKSLKSLQFAKTKQQCLRAMAILSRWPLVRGTDMSFFEVGLGAVCMGRADYSQAESLFASAVERYRRYMTKHGARYKSRLTPNMVVLLSHFSRACAAQGKHDQSELAANEALELARTIRKKAYARIELFAVSALGYSHLRSGALEQAESEYNQVLQLYAETPEIPTYGSTVFAPILTAATLGLAIIAIKQGKTEASLQHWTSCVERIMQASTPTSPTFLRGLNLLANEYMNNKLFAEAENVLDIAYSVALHHFDHPDAKETLNYFEKLLLLTGRQTDVGDMRAWLRLSQQRTD
jgi:tetratricopeptide (TPR) repeat protein